MAPQGEEKGESKVGGVHHEESRDGDVRALLEFHEATDGRHWRTPWDLTADAETWCGVAMNDNGRVAALKTLARNNIRGNISATSSN